MVSSHCHILKQCLELFDTGDGLFSDLFYANELKQCSHQPGKSGKTWLKVGLYSLYSSAIFCSRYCQLVIVMFMIISVTVEQCDRNSKVPCMQPYKFKTAVLEHNVHTCAQPEPLLPSCLFSKHKTK